jgi:general secretion pathway protein B
MSFILDALKKSEIERQRQTVPGLMDTRREGRRSRLPVWALVLAVLLGINLLVLIFVLMRNNAPAAHAPRPAQAQTPSAPDAAAAPPAAEHFSPLDATPVYAPEIPVASAGGAAAPESPMTSPPSASRPPATAPSLIARLGLVGGSGKTPPRPVHRPDPVLTDEDAAANSQEILPSISEISLSGEQALPELHLDVHVYSTKPADRFVYINMRKYHEGAVLQEGPTVERIRRDGVVLNYQNLRFILPRQP